jgi:hypothetical protein
VEKSAGVPSVCFEVLATEVSTEELAAEDFYIQKNLRASPGFEPANSGTRGQHANH